MSTHTKQSRIVQRMTRRVLKSLKPGIRSSKRSAVPPVTYAEVRALVVQGVRS